METWPFVLAPFYIFQFPQGFFLTFLLYHKYDLEVMF